MLAYAVLKFLLCFCLININDLCTGEMKFRSDYTLFGQVNAWFKLHLVQNDWHSARLQCYYEGAILASPLDLDMLWILKNIMIQAKLDTIFTGVHATHNNSVYTSVEGVPLEQMPIQWKDGEPKNYGKGEECMALLNGGLGVKHCEDYAPYICYRKVNASDELNECGTIDHDYKLDARTGHCYKFHEDTTTWPRAYSICQAEGGYLTIINSEEEAAVLKELNTKYTIKTGAIFIGFRKWGPSDSFWTIHGETVERAGYAIWDDNQPNNILSEDRMPQLCGAMVPNAKLNDFWCFSILPFICEKTKDSLLNLQPGYYKFASCFSDGKGNQNSPIETL